MQCVACFSILKAKELCRKIVFAELEAATSVILSAAIAYEKKLSSVVEEDCDDSLLRKRFLSATTSRTMWKQELPKQKVTRRHSSPAWVCMLAHFFI